MLITTLNDLVAVVAYYGTSWIFLLNVLKLGVEKKWNNIKKPIASVWVRLAFSGLAIRFKVMPILLNNSAFGVFFNF